ncbi:MAG: sigma-54-dependent transcriptional regulator, partial [Planctomycetia bacterium]
MARHLKPLIIIADDDPVVILLLNHHLERWGYRTSAAASKVELLAQLADETPAMLLLDLRFGECNGVELFQEIRPNHPHLNVVMLTAHGSIENAVSAMKLGAYDFLTKPPDLNRLQVICGHAVEQHTLRQKIRRLERLVETQSAGQSLLGAGAAIRTVRETIASVAPTDATVLVLGESGTGKELVARALHENSRRAGGPFIPVNMAALPRELVESTLFGHERGAFTGADQVQIGCCEAADGGTLFLDEIGEMELPLQTKLLRFLQERTILRVGSSRSHTVDVRIVAATNQDPQEQVKRGQLRQDLYYRLNVVPMKLPPLRERMEDVPLLAAAFLRRAAARVGRDITGFTQPALDVLLNYSWPGNVRELENVVERVAIFCREAEVGVAQLPADLRAAVGVEVAAHGAATSPRTTDAGYAVSSSSDALSPIDP